MLSPTLNTALLPDERHRYQNALAGGNLKVVTETFDGIEVVDPAEMFPRTTLEIQRLYFASGTSTYGGGFVKLLAEAYRKGDEENRRKIRMTWPELWLKYVVYGCQNQEHDTANL